MEFKDSVFETEAKIIDEENTLELSKVWKDEELFPLLKKDLEKINKELIDLKIGKVTFANQLGDDFDKWISKDQITLVILPENNIVDDTGTATKEYVRQRGLTAKDKYYSIDITDSSGTNKGFAVYYPSKNIILAKVNPFVDSKLYAYFMEDLKSCNAKFLSQDDIWMDKLQEQWTKNLKGREERIQSEIKSIESNVKSYEDQYIQSIKNLAIKTQEIEKMKEIKVGFEQHINKELEAAKKLPMLKLFEITDKIRVGFGTVYINGKVQVGTKMENGIKVPDVQMQKVEIGNLIFTIEDNKVRVKNDKPVDGYRHPHASQDMCFGQASTEMNKLLANMELCNLIKLLYSWSFSYNSGDAMHSLQYFWNARNGKATEDDDGSDDDSDDDNNDGE